MKHLLLATAIFSALAMPFEKASATENQNPRLVLAKHHVQHHHAHKHTKHKTPKRRRRA